MGSASKSGMVRSGSRWPTVALFIIIIIAIVVAAILASGYPGGQSASGSFQQFMSNFNSAPRVAIYETDYVIAPNQTGLQYTVRCGSDIMQAIGRNLHRNSSTEDVYTLNETACIINKNPGLPSSSVVNSSAASCLSSLGSVPSIFINYSAVNSTTVTDNNNVLAVSGDAQFLLRCGVQSSLVAK